MGSRSCRCDNPGPIGKGSLANLAAMEHGPEPDARCARWPARPTSRWPAPRRSPPLGLPGAPRRLAARHHPAPGPGHRRVRRRAAAAGMRLLLIRRHGRRPADPARSRVVPGRHHARATATTPHRGRPVGTGRAPAARPGEPLPGTPLTDPLLLVCTHGRRDRCCALDGRALAAALAAAEEPHVWECSHLGGHRFAPTALVLPTGYLYGHLDPASAVAARKAAGGRRGRAGPLPGPFHLVARRAGRRARGPRGDRAPRRGRRCRAPASRRHGAGAAPGPANAGWSRSSAPRSAPAAPPRAAPGRPRSRRSAPAACPAAPARPAATSQPTAAGRCPSVRSASDGVPAVGSSGA